MNEPQQNPQPNDTQLPSQHEMIPALPERFGLLEGCLRSVGEHKQSFYRGVVVVVGGGGLLAAIYNMTLTRSAEAAMWFGLKTGLALLIAGSALAGVVILLHGGVKTTQSQIAYQWHILRAPSNGPLQGALSSPDEDLQGALSPPVQGGELRVLEQPDDA